DEVGGGEAGGRTDEEWTLLRAVPRLGACTNATDVAHVHFSPGPSRDPHHEVALLQRSVLQADGETIIPTSARRHPQEVARASAVQSGRAGDRDAGRLTDRAPRRERLVELSRE